MRLKYLIPPVALIVGLAATWGAWHTLRSDRAQHRAELSQAQLETGEATLKERFGFLEERLALFQQAAQEGGPLDELAARARSLELSLVEARRVEQWPKRLRSRNLRLLERETGLDLELRIEADQLAAQDELWVLVDSLPQMASRLGQVLAAAPVADEFGQPYAQAPAGAQAQAPMLWYGFAHAGRDKPLWTQLALDLDPWAQKLVMALPQGLGVEVNRAGRSLVSKPAPGQGQQRSSSFSAPLAGQTWELRLSLMEPEPKLIADQEEAILLVGLVLLTLLTAFGLYKLCESLERTGEERDLWTARTVCYKKSLEEVRAEMGLSPALRSALEAICAYAGWPLAHVTLPDESRQQAQLNLWHEQTEGQFKSFIDAAESRNFQSGESLVDRVLAHEKIVWIENIGDDPSFSKVKIQYDFGVKSAVGFPVVIHGDIVTVLEFYSDDQLEWDQEKIDWTAAVIDQVSSLLEAHWAIQGRRRLLGRFEALFGQIDEPVLLLNVEGLVESANEALQRLTGYTEQELQGRGLDLLLGEHEKLVDQTLQALVEGSKLPFKRNLKLRRKDGGLIEAAWACSANETEGRRTLLVRVQTDPEERPQKKPTLAKQLSSGYEAKHQLATEAKLRSDYLAALGQEVQTPALAVSNLSRRLLHEPRAEERRPLLQVLSQLGDQVSRKLTRAMELARLESGGLSLAEHPFDLRRLVGRVLDRYADQAQAKGLDLFSYINTEVPFHLVGDPQRIEEALSILLENGVQYTPKGNVHLEVMALNQANQSVELVFKVSDDGPGIEKERLSNLSQQITGKVKPGKEAGQPALGLRLANGLAVRLGGGGLRFKSMPNQGLSVSLNVKLSVQPEQEASGVSLVRDLSGARVLLVEPNEALAQVLQKYLLAWGAQPLTVKTAVELQKLISSQGDTLHVDLILFDGLAAGTQAGDQLHSIRKQFEQVPLVWLSDRKGNKKAPEEERLGPIALLPKPVKTLELYPLLMAQLDRWDEETAAQEPGPDTQILVVDDQKEEAHLMIQALEEAGFEVSLAQSAQEALEAFREGNFGLVLADLSLPGTDGVELIKRLRAWEQGQMGFTRPLFALVSQADSARRLDAFRAGADQALSKPLNPTLLVEQVKDALYL